MNILLSWKGYISNKIIELENWFEEKRENQ